MLSYTKKCATGHLQVQHISSAHRYRDHRICPQAALADLAVATFHSGIKLEDLAKYIVAAPGMQGNHPMSGETLNVHLRQAFDLAGEPVH